MFILSILKASDVSYFICRYFIPSEAQNTMNFVLHTSFSILSLHCLDLQY